MKGTYHCLLTFIIVLFVGFSGVYAQQEWKTAKASNGFSYKYVEDDPAHARFYTLNNGLTVILSPSNKKPRIQTFIAVKAGSKTDPSTHTGLAHYLEHMLFKGTDKFGSLDWEKEKPYLDKIETLYEEYNSTTDEVKRKTIYRAIDSVSGEAAKYAIANEYDKLMASMGAKGTNAFTSFEQTVYTEDIPSNAIDKYLTVQAERFRNPVFRLFHTELEAVYEEKNRSLDSDGSRVFEKLFSLLFPDNNYGKQTTIGTIEHLKNPSLVEIRKYFNTYYVPNNMGIVMAGDFDPDELIEKIDSYFGNWKPKEVPPYNVGIEKSISKPIEAEVFGPEAEEVNLAFRFPGANTDDAQLLELVGNILTNGSAGMIDLNLVKKQKLQEAYAFNYNLKDYSVLWFSGMPVSNQSLEEVKKLLLGEIEKLKKGEFSDHLIQSIINNEKKDNLRAIESYNGVAYRLLSSFTSEIDWAKEVNYVNKLGKISKQDIIDFANKYLHDNYVVVYKRKGEPSDVQKVEKPEITPVSVNRDDQSDFLQMVGEMHEKEIKPIWVDYKNDIQRTNSGKYEVLGVKNNDNELFSLSYYYNTGSWSNKLLPIAADFLEYLGTKEKSAEEISQEFYSLATNFSVYPSSENIYITLSGLQENFDQSIQIFDDLLRHCEVDKDVFDTYIERLLKEREDDLINRWAIKSGLRDYALYGPKNPFNNVLTNSELKKLKPKDLLAVLHEMATFEHKILYYGPLSAEDIAKKMEKLHPTPTIFTPLPKPVVFEQLKQTENTVLVANYDMVQAEIFWSLTANKYDISKVAQQEFFNEYFGRGMNSIVFQTIRESKALAYSTYAFMSAPSKKEYYNTFTAYVGTQADKFKDATIAMNELLNELPRSEKAVEVAKDGLKKNIATNRTIGNSILFSYLNAKRKGLDYDINKDVYEAIPNLNLDSLQKFFEQHIKGKPYVHYVLMGEGKVDEKDLESLGKVKLLKVEELFGY